MIFWTDNNRSKLERDFAKPVKLLLSQYEDYGVFAHNAITGNILSL